MTERKKLEAELAEAERALAATLDALRTHGHQGMTWGFLRTDSQRVRELRQALAAEMERGAKP